MTKQAKKQSLEIGQTVPGKGIYFGEHETFGKMYRLYAAPEDIPIMNYNQAKEYVSNLKDWHGNSDWFIPTLDMLEDLYNFRETGDFKDTFVTRNCSGNAHWYWSCTERRSDSSRVYVVVFTAGLHVWDHKDDLGQSSRPVRAEVRK